MTQIDDYVIQRVKVMRIERNLSQQALADMLNVSQSFIRDIENPKRIAKYNLTHLNDIAFIFNCSFADFFPEVPFKPKQLQF